MVGSYEAIAADADMLAYVRAHEGRHFLVVLNLGAEPAELRLPEGIHKGRIVICTDAGREGEDVGENMALRGNEGIVVRLGG
jgi:hypothetical protein